MPRYLLIIKNETYVALYRYCGEKGKSMGRVINEILDQFVRELQADGHMPVEAICIVCGAKAALEVSGRGQQKFFLCPEHKPIATRVGFWRQLSHQ